MRSMLRSPRLKKHLKKWPAQPTFGNTRMVPPKRKQFHIAAAYFDHSRRVRTKTNRNRNDSKARCKSILFHLQNVWDLIWNARPEVLDSWFDRNGQTMSFLDFYSRTMSNFDFLSQTMSVFDFVRLYRALFDFVRLYRKTFVFTGNYPKPPELQRKSDIICRIMCQKPQPGQSPKTI